MLAYGRIADSDAHLGSPFAANSRAHDGELERVEQAPSDDFLTLHPFDSSLGRQSSVSFFGPSPLSDVGVAPELRRHAGLELTSPSCDLVLPAELRPPRLHCFISSSHKSGPWSDLPSLEELTDLVLEPGAPRRSVLDHHLIRAIVFTCNATSCRPSRASRWRSPTISNRRLAPRYSPCRPSSTNPECLRSLRCLRCPRTLFQIERLH